MKNEERMFPAVTVCNLNPYKKSELMNVPELAALVRLLDLIPLMHFGSLYTFTVRDKSTL